MGHLFQNRDNSIVVKEGAYLLEFVRYLPLNPLRAKVLHALRRLDRNPWPGHSALLGTVPTLFGGTQTHPAVTARQLLAYLWVEVLGRPASGPPRAVGQTRRNVSLAAQRGVVHAARWRAQIPTWC